MRLSLGQYHTVLVTGAVVSSEIRKCEFLASFFVFRVILPISGYLESPRESLGGFLSLYKKMSLGFGQGWH